MISIFTIKALMAFIGYLNNPSRIEYASFGTAHFTYSHIFLCAFPLRLEDWPRLPEKREKPGFRIFQDMTGVCETIFRLGDIQIFDCDPACSSS